MRLEPDGQRWYWILGRRTTGNWCPHPPITDWAPTLFIGRNCVLMSGSQLHKYLYPVSNTERWKTDYGRHQRQVNVRKIINILQCCSHSILVLVSSDRSLSQGPGGSNHYFWFPTFLRTQDPIQFLVIFHALLREKHPNSIHTKHIDVAQIFSSQYLKICSNVI